MKEKNKNPWVPYIFFADSCFGPPLAKKYKEPIEKH